MLKKWDSPFQFIKTNLILFHTIIHGIYILYIFWMKYSLNVHQNGILLLIQKSRRKYRDKAAFSLNVLIENFTWSSAFQWFDWFPRNQPDFRQNKWMVNNSGLRHERDKQYSATLWFMVKFLYPYTYIHV